MILQPRLLTSPIHKLISIVGFLVGLLAVLWWQKWQDERLLQQMEEAVLASEVDQNSWSTRLRAAKAKDDERNLFP